MSGVSSVVVVGTGLAGLRTVAELRAQGFDAAVTWVGHDADRPYDRPPLSKELLSRQAPVWLAEDLQIDVADLNVIHLEATATALSPGERPLLTTTGGELSADAVVLATGSTPTRPWPGALVLHGLADAARLRAAIVPGARMIVIGAGWIGAELAGVAAGAGAVVTVLEAGPGPLWRQLGDTGERTRAWYADAGVDLRTGVIVQTADADRVRLEDGTVLEADVVVAAVGVRPASGWLGAEVPTTDRGHVIVDRGGRTQARGVWAVGDVAERSSALFGPVTGGHWFSALRDPEFAVADLLGGDLPTTEPAPEMWSDQLGHHLEVFGRLTWPGEPSTERVLRDLGTGWTEVHLLEGSVVGAVVADAPREVAAVRKALRGERLPEVDPAVLGDTGIALRTALGPR